MILGPGFQRDVYLAAFPDALRTANFVIRPLRRQDSAIIAAYFNADDHAPLRKRLWDAEDYTAGYVEETVFDHLQSIEKEHNRLQLGIFTQDESTLVGEALFYAYGHKDHPYLSCDLLPSQNTVGNFKEAHRAIINWAAQVSLIRKPDPGIYDTLTQIFNLCANHAIETPRLSIRPYQASDTQSLLDFYAADERAAPAYYQLPEDSCLGDVILKKQISTLESDKFDMGIFIRDTKTLIGELHFWQDEHMGYRMSYFVLPSWRGKGFAAEAHKAGIEWSDRALPSPITRAGFVTGNTSSEKVLLKSGFHSTGEFICATPGMEGVAMVGMERKLPEPKTP